MLGIFRPVTRIFHQHGRKADLAQSRYFMQCYNQLNDVSVPGVLGNYNGFEVDTAGNVFPRFFHLELGLNSTIIKNPSDILQCCCFMPRKASFALLTPDSEGVRCNISTLESKKTPQSLRISCFVEPISQSDLENLLSTNFDSWFTYCVLSQQKTFSVEFVLWTLWLRKISVWESKIAFNPPPPPSLLLLYA